MTSAWYLVEPMSAQHTASSTQEIWGKRLGAVEFPIPCSSFVAGSSGETLARGVTWAQRVVPIHYRGAQVPNPLSHARMLGLFLLTQRQTKVSIRFISYHQIFYQAVVSSVPHFLFAWLKLSLIDADK